MQKPLTFSGVSVNIIEIEKDSVLIKITGYLDTYNSTDFYRYISREILEIDKYQHFLFDLQGLSYASSTGIGSILQIAKTVATKKGELRLYNVNKSVKNVMSLLGFTPFFDFCEEEKVIGCLDNEDK